MDRSRVAAIGALTGLSEEELDAVASVASELEFATGDAVITEGDFGHSLFLIEDGSADVSIDGTTVHTCGPGEVLGEIAVLSSGRRTASVVATSPLRVIALFKRDVWALERAAPDAARRLRAALEEHQGSTSAG